MLTEDLLRLNIIYLNYHTIPERIKQAGQALQLTVLPDDAFINR
jgi:hypothetical protein